MYARDAYVHRTNKTTIVRERIEETKTTNGGGKCVNLLTATALR